MPLEVELQSVVDDVDAARQRLEAAGARLVFDGQLEDRWYDTPNRRLAALGQVLRLPVYRDDNAARASTDRKGPTCESAGYKVRDEISARMGDPRAGFTAERLTAFVERLERRTGERAAVSTRQLADGSRVPTDA